MEFKEYDPEVLKRLQQVELEILDVIAEVCEKNDIKWFIDGGSAIGAMRHQGFIPWDDDVDIGMLRPEYERFLEVAPRDLPEGFSLHTPDNTENYSMFFAKVWKDSTRFMPKETQEAGYESGIYIDIYPYDAVSDDEAERKRQLSQASLWLRMNYLYHSKSIAVPGYGIVGAAQKALCRVGHYGVKLLFNKKKIRERFDGLTDPADTTSKDVAIFTYPYVGSFPRAFYENLDTAMFEGRELPIPSHIDEHLTIMYGDTWNQLPPEDRRKNHAPDYLDFGDGKNAC